jgi:hypothetical protein
LIRVTPLRKDRVRAINLPCSREAKYEMTFYCKADPDVKVVRIVEVKFIPTRIDAGLVDVVDAADLTRMPSIMANSPCFST